MALSKWVILVATVASVLSSGSLYGYGLFAPALKDKLALTQTQINLVGASGSLGQYLGFVSGLVNDVWGNRKCCLWGGLLLFVGYLFLALAAGGWIGSTVPWQLLCLFTFAIGQGSFAVYTSAFTLSTANFPRSSRSLVVSLHVTAFALSSILFAAIYAIFFSADHGIPGLAPYLFVLTGATTVLAWGAAPFFQKLDLVITTDDIVMLEDNKGTTSVDLEEEGGTTAAATTTTATAADLTPLQTLRRLDFWMLLLNLGLVNGPGIMWLTVQGTIARNFDANIVILVLTLGAGSVGGRILSGIACDYFVQWGISRCWWLMPPAVVMATAHLLFALWGSFALVHVCACLVGAAYGAAYAISVTLISCFFGLTYYGTNNGLCAVGPAVLGMPLSWFAGRIYDAAALNNECTNSLDCFRVAFIVSGCCALSANAIVIYLSLKHKNLS